MKNLSEDFLFMFSVLSTIFIISLVGFGTDSYKEYLKTYNTQQDREMFLKSYEIVLECRKSYGLNTSSADKMCGQVPTFVDNVK